MSDSKDQPRDKGDDDMVIAPGGPRPKNEVHPVAPGEVVRQNPDGSYSVVRQTPPSDGEKEDSNE